MDLPCTRYFFQMLVKFPPFPWNQDWAQAAELFAEHSFGPYTRDELRRLIIRAEKKNNAQELQRFFDLIQKGLPTSEEIQEGSILKN
jgi:hypothetical protein